MIKVLWGPKTFGVIWGLFIWGGFPPSMKKCDLHFYRKEKLPLFLCQLKNLKQVAAEKSHTLQTESAEEKPFIGGKETHIFSRHRKRPSADRRGGSGKQKLAFLEGCAFKKT